MKVEMETPVIAKPYRSHEDATVESFSKNPEYAAAYLAAVLKDGDAAELRVALARMALAFDGKPKAPRREA
jgi:DNA-binding phage protein